MTCLLNEEIMAIRNLMTHLEKAIPLETNSHRKLELKELYKEANKELEVRLQQCEDYKG